MPNTPKSPASPNKREITLSALLTAVDPEAQVLIIHHMGANCYEAVATGPAWEIGVWRFAAAAQLRKSPSTLTATRGQQPPS